MQRRAEVSCPGLPTDIHGKQDDACTASCNFPLQVLMSMVAREFDSFKTQKSLEALQWLSFFVKFRKNNCSIVRY
ncbi:MAG: hypothetical protein LKH06_06010, partial [Eubacterium sp.]|nr:hypothetical protein [Eubacterium sp.]